MTKLDLLLTLAWPSKRGTQSKRKQELLQKLHCVASCFTCFIFDLRTAVVSDDSEVGVVAGVKP